MVVGDKAYYLLAEFSKISKQSSKVNTANKPRSTYRMKVTRLRETDEIAPSCQVVSSGQNMT